MYELQDRLAMLHFDSLSEIDSDGYGQPDNLVMMRYTHDGENDNNYNEYRLPLPPPLPFGYESPIYARSLSITDVDYESTTTTTTVAAATSNNNNAIPASSPYDENDYDDVEEESPKKGLLKQMFCLPLN